jgi:predicted nucleotidyltransferase
LLSGRQVHLLAGVGSEAGVRLVLTRLTGTGLVRVHDAGNSMLYTLNRDHLAAEAVEKLANLRTVFIRTLAGEISNWNIAPIHASLFGSTARGDSGVDSDVDVLLVRSDSVDELDPQWQEQTGRLSEHVLTRTGNRTQLYDITASALVAHVTTDEPLVNEWRRDAITLCGPDFGNVLRQLTSTGGDQ